MLDEWSLVHVGGGILLGLVVKDPWQALGLIVGWEVVEWLLRLSGLDWGALSAPESLENVALDVVLGYAAWWLASR